MILSCPTCHKAIPAGSSSCPHCGTSVHSTTESHSLGEQATLGAKCCPFCGRPMDPVSGTCTVCLPAASSSGTASSPGTHSRAVGECVELEFEKSSAAVKEPAGKAPDAASTTAALRQIRPGTTLLRWDLTRPYYSIGRERAKIVLPDRHVSRRHLAVAQVGPDWLVINRSEHGMRINGEALTQKTLRSGDILRIGQTSLVFDAGKTSSPGKPLRSMAGLLAREPRARTAGLRTL